MVYNFEIAHAMAPDQATKDYFNIVIGDTIEDVYNTSVGVPLNNFEYGSRPATPLVESRPTTPIVESISGVPAVELTSSESSSQVNTRDFHSVISNPTRTFLFQEGIHGYKYGPINPALQTNYSINSHINYNVSNPISSNSCTIQSILNPIHVNSTIGHQSIIMQNIAESSSQAQSNIDQIRNIAELGYGQPIPKPSWVEDIYNLEGTKYKKSMNHMLTSTLPWHEIQLSDISKLNRPKILGINFDFLHQNIEAIFQEFKHGKAFYVSHEHIPGLTPNNYKDCIINYYFNNASNRPSILIQAIFVENGDAMKVFRGK